jgi:hypothetical protein
MPPTSDEELKELQENVEDLRAQVVDANAEREAYEKSLANDVTAAQLKAEQARLQAELTTINAATDASQVEGAGASVPLVQATALMEAALAGQDAASSAAEAGVEARSEAALEAAKAASETDVSTPPTSVTPTPPPAPPSGGSTFVSNSDVSTGTEV